MKGEKKTTKQIGDEGEKIAHNYLVKKGYRLKESNFRSGRNEIDLIYEYQGVLVFVEVKFRKTNFFGFGEDFVDEKKMNRLQAAAEDYLNKVNWEKDIQFDIVAVTPTTIEHFEDV